MTSPSHQSTPATPETLGEHIGYHVLGQLISDELGAATHAAITAHLGGCGRCQELHDQLLADRRDFLDRRPTSAFLSDLRGRRAALSRAAVGRSWWSQLKRWPDRPRGLSAAAAGFTLAATVAVTLAITGTGTGTGTGDLDGARGAGGDDGISNIIGSSGGAIGTSSRIKGAYELSFHVWAKGAVTLGKPGGAYHPGDAIQLRYSSPTPSRLVVVSVDSAGAVTPFYDDAGHGLAVDAGAAVLLDGSITLDDTLGPERVIGCFCTNPVTTREIIRAARAGLATAQGDPRAVKRLDIACAQATFLIDKVARLDGESAP